MIPASIVQTGVGSSAWYALNPNISPSNVSVACTVSGTVNYSVQYAYDNPPTTAWNDTLVQGYTVSAVAIQDQPVSYVRITIASGTGTVSAVVLQAGIVQANPNVPVGSTGQYQFGSIYASDLMFDCYERIGWRAASLTDTMMLSAQRSFNFVQSRWSNLGVNLWEVTLQSISLEQGVTTYAIDPTTIDLLPEVTVRTWNLSTLTNIAPAFSVTANSKVCTVTQPNNGLLVGNYVNVATPVAVGGIVIYGFYSVVSTPTPDTYTITLTAAAVSTTSGGTVPTFTTDGTTSSVTVALTNQPFLAGQTFNVEVSTQVGGLTLLGQYLITSAATNSFVINATVPSSSVQTVTMNSGNMQIQSQPQSQAPTDIVLYPMSRPDYTALSNKFVQGRPTSFWFDRTLTPTVTIWPVPDQNGPYQMLYYKNSQMQDASIQNGAQINIPYRFMEAYAAACASHLAIKWRPEVAKDLEAYARQVWQEASDMDREKVSMFISPDFSGYFLS